MADGWLVNAVDLARLLRLRFAQSRVGPRNLDGFGNRYEVRLEEGRDLSVQLAVYESVDVAREAVERRVRMATVGPAEVPGVGDELLVWQSASKLGGSVCLRRDNAVMNLGRGVRGSLPLDQRIELARWFDRRLREASPAVGRAKAVQAPRITIVGIPARMTPGSRVEARIEIAASQPDHIAIAVLHDHAIVRRKPAPVLIYDAPADQDVDRFRVMISDRRNRIGCEEVVVRMKGAIER